MSIEELKKCLLTAGHNLSMEEVTALYSRHIMTMEKLPVDVLKEIFQHLPYRSIQYFCLLSKDIKEKCSSPKLAKIIEEKKMLTYVGGMKRPITSRNVAYSLLEEIFEPEDDINKYKLLIPLVSTDGKVVSPGKVITANWKINWKIDFDKGRVQLNLVEALLEGKRKVRIFSKVNIDTADSSFIVKEQVPDLSIPISGKNSKTQALEIVQYFFGDKAQSNKLLIWEDLTSDDLVNPLPFSHDQGKFTVEAGYGSKSAPITIIIEGSTKFIELIFVREDGKMILRGDSFTKKRKVPLFGVEPKDEDTEDDSEDEEDED